MRIQLFIEDESGRTTTAEIAAIERRQSDDLIGISLEEAKAMTGSVQRAMVESQAGEAIERGSQCPHCQVRLRRNGSHRISYRTPFGRLELDSPRFYRCRCEMNGRLSFSPLARRPHESGARVSRVAVRRSVVVRRVRPHPGHRAAAGAGDEHHDVEAARGASRESPRRGSSPPTFQSTRSQ